MSLDWPEGCAIQVSPQRVLLTWLEQTFPLIHQNGLPSRLRAQQPGMKVKDCPGRTPELYATLHGAKIGRCPQPWSAEAETCSV